MLVYFLLQFEADRRAFIITINSFGTELSKEDRAKLFPHCGKLYPEGLAQLARADDYEQVKAVADFYPVSVCASGSEQMFKWLENALQTCTFSWFEKSLKNEVWKL